MHISRLLYILLTHGYHPFHAKFIPQIPRTIIEHLTKKGDIVLDPFCGSGTTLVQCNELGMHSIGIDISEFNALISNVKIGNYNFLDLRKEILNITEALKIEVSVDNRKLLESQLGCIFISTGVVTNSLFDFSFKHNTHFI